MTIAISGTTGITLDGQFNSASSMGFKNRIINGAMVINQRATSRALTSTEEYVVDRWVGCSYGGNTVTFAQSTSIYPTGYAYSFGATNSGTTTAGTSSFYAFRQKIEGLNGIDFAFGSASANPIIFSFWARSSVTGTYTIGIINGALNRANRNTFTINAIDTWEQKTVTFTGDTSGTWATNNTTFMYVDVVLSAGSNSNDTANTWTANTKESTSSATNTWCTTNGATFYITGVQLEKGSTATSFDYRPYGTELALCQRYAYQYVSPAAKGVGDGTNMTRAGFNHPVQMRAAPTATLIGTISTYDGSTARNISSILNSYMTSTVFEVDFATGGSTIGRAMTIYQGTGSILVSAEL